MADKSEADIKGKADRQLPSQDSLHIIRAVPRFLTLRLEERSREGVIDPPRPRLSTLPAILSPERKIATEPKRLA